MTTILVALLFFSIIIMIHELRHFLTARAVGIHAEEFSIGMGPRLLKIPGKETTYSLRALLLEDMFVFLEKTKPVMIPELSTMPKSGNVFW